MASMFIKKDDLSHPEVQNLLQAHFEELRSNDPAKSCHVLSLDELRRSDVSLYSAWNGEGSLLGCGALKELDPKHGEIKSMRTATAHLRKGVARAMTKHLLAEARRRGYTRVSLETGWKDKYASARGLYKSLGFEKCDAYVGYAPDPNSVFMTIELYLEKN
jgi:putative acetyltransferase